MSAETPIGAQARSGDKKRWTFDYHLGGNSSLRRFEKSNSDHEGAPDRAGNKNKSRNHQLQHSKPVCESDGDAIKWLHAHEVSSPH
ncbi:hypothetical protein T265_10391 [Opisthorchis viverrini]|uniref:Uncharacterized protein n=1 Tax=Opisthorchis viverrini TaxID=6198 RepID=A0A074Z2F6_OPIVI|nr:hypothetical protein T265_10391 [Opisthorchis viverrini]KER21231.1 hypothetical protein T265_10391 [Opisthorchis viverrini]